MNAGADDYLTKPLDPEELSARLVVASRISQLYRQLAAQRSELELLNQKLFDQHGLIPDQVATRLKLSEDLDLIVSQSEHYHQQYCAVMCDLDYFKLYNDAYGHLAGDKILRLVAQTLHRGSRIGDRAYRYGGEEFLLILRAISVNDCLALAERLRESIEALRIPHGESPHKVVTITMGMAVFAQGRKPAAWLEGADAALYEAKRLGRNRVVLSRHAPSISAVPRQLPEPLTPVSWLENWVESLKKAHCRKCYVHPEVLSSYMDGNLLLEIKSELEGDLRDALAGLKPEEAAVLRCCAAVLPMRLLALPRRQPIARPGGSTATSTRVDVAASRRARRNHDRRLPLNRDPNPKHHPPTRRESATWRASKRTMAGFGSDGWPASEQAHVTILSS